MGVRTLVECGRVSGVYSRVQVREPLLESSELQFGEAATREEEPAVLCPGGQQGRGVVDGELVPLGVAGDEQSRRAACGFTLERLFGVG